VESSFPSDNELQFAVRDLATLIGRYGMTHVRTLLSSLQSCTIVEHWPQVLGSEHIRTGLPLPLGNTPQPVDRVVMYDEHGRVYSASGCVAPEDKLEGPEPTVSAERKHRLAIGYQKRSLARGWHSHRLPRRAVRQRLERLSKGHAPGSIGKRQCEDSR